MTSWLLENALINLVKEKSDVSLIINGESFDGKITAFDDEILQLVTLDETKIYLFKIELCTISFDAPVPEEDTGAAF